MIQHSCFPPIFQLPQPLEFGQQGTEGAEPWNLLLQQPHPSSPWAALDDQKVTAEAAVQTYLNKNL